jgi:hypothetical protein
MSRWLRRIDLAQHGWCTEARFSKVGTSSKDPNVGIFGVWARRGFWGHSLSDVCLYSTVRIDLSEPGCEHDVYKAFDTVFEGCHRAMREYVDAVPCQVSNLTDGRLGFAESSSETNYMRNFVGEVHPTENIDSNWLLYRGSFDHVEALLEAAREGLYVDDSLNCRFGFSRMAREVTNREWGYSLKLFPTTRNEERASFAPIETTTRLLNEDAVSGLIQQSAKSVVDLFDAFAPRGKFAGNTKNGLPPGFTLRADVLEAKRLVDEANDIDQPLKM